MPDKYIAHVPDEAYNLTPYPYGLNNPLSLNDPEGNLVSEIEDICVGNSVDADYWKMMGELKYYELAYCSSNANDEKTTPFFHINPNLNV